MFKVQWKDQETTDVRTLVCYDLKSLKEVIRIFDDLRMEFKVCVDKNNTVPQGNHFECVDQEYFMSIDPNFNDAYNYWLEPKAKFQ